MARSDRPAERLTRAEVLALFAAASPDSLTGKRSRALIVVLWRGGLRCAEALALRVSDIDMQAGTIRVLRGKGHKPRTVGIDPEAVAVIQQWVAAKRAAGLRSRTLFCTIRGPDRGRPMDDETGARTVRALIAGLGRAAGIDKHVHPHGLRHTHAGELRAEGVSMPVIQRQLGHSNLNTTQIYLDDIMPLEVIETMRHRAWGPGA